MDNLVSTWSKTAQILPESYIFPVGERPGSVEVPFFRNIPLIDLAASQSPRQMIQEILAACQEYGFFQVINHGVSQDLMDDTMKVAKDFFNMPNVENAKLYSNDPSKSCRLSTATYQYDNINFWRDNLRHQCHPLNECVHSWPEKPTNYRDVVGNYSLEVRKLSLRILELISEGLGLECGYFKKDLTASQWLTINHYPRCPDPDLTLGIRKHVDPNVIAVLLQGNVYGLQVLKDGQWLGVEPLPHAFVVNIGYQLEIISNGKLRSVEHRAVTNSKEDRTSIVTFTDPCQDAIIEPAKSMIDTGIPLYRSFRYRDFRKFFTEKKGDPEALMAAYKFKA